jgi:CRISPR-associated protein Cas6
MDTSWFDICFPATGNAPINYEYALFSAINHEIGDIHQADWLGIHPIYGKREKNTIYLNDLKYPIRFRVEKTHRNFILSLANRKLFLDNHPIILGEPAMFKIKYHNSLISRKVSFNGMKNDFENEIKSFLDKHNIIANIQIGNQRKCFIKDKFNYGYEVKFTNLIKEHSLFLQQNGVFGGRRFGFGVFTKYLA